MIRCVMFDLDGTLCDTLQDLGEAMNAALRTEGFPEHEFDAYRWMVGSGMLKLVQRALPPEVRDKSELVDLMCRREKDYYSKHLLDHTLPYPGIMGSVTALKNSGIRLYVVTNKPQSMAERITDTLFPDCFSGILGQRQGYPVKPDPWAVGTALEESGCSLEEGLLVGDSDVDVQTARRGGVPCIGVTWGFRGRKELEKAGAWKVVDTTEELLETIRTADLSDQKAVNSCRKQARVDF